MSKSRQPVNITQRAADTSLSTLKEKATIFGKQTEEFRISGTTKTNYIRILKRFVVYMRSSVADMDDDDERSQLQESFKSDPTEDPFCCFEAEHPIPSYVVKAFLHDIQFNAKKELISDSYLGQHNSAIIYLYEQMSNYVSTKNSINELRHTFPRDHELGYVRWRVHTKKVGHDIVTLSKNKRECDCWRDILLHFEYTAESQRKERGRRQQKPPTRIFTFYFLYFSCIFLLIWLLKLNRPSQFLSEIRHTLSKTHRNNRRVYFLVLVFLQALKLIKVKY